MEERSNKRDRRKSTKKKQVDDVCAVEEDTIRASHGYCDLSITLTFKAQPNGAHHEQ